MKVAVTLFGRRVSPRFDVAPEMLIIDTAQNDDAAQQVLDLTTQSAFQRVQTLKELHVEALICGAVDQDSSLFLSQAGIQLYTWVTGMADEALWLFQEDRLTSGIILRGPGKQPHRWRFRCRRGSPFNRDGG